MLTGKKIGIIGAGSMGLAIAKGLIKSGVPKEDVLISHPRKERRELLQEAGLRVTEHNYLAVEASDIVIFCVKPQILLRVMHELGTHITEDQILVSIAAGITMHSLLESIAKKPALVRVMPNIPLTVGAGMSALCASANTSAEQLGCVEHIFNSLGKTVRVDEDQLDAVTGLSGSGPAFIFLVIDALADAGVKVGLSREVSLTLAAQTVYGSAKLLIESKMHPSQLKDQVTSPGGTAIEGIHTLEEGGLRNTLINAVERAAMRSKELGTKKK